MSRAYRIRIVASDSLRRDITAADQICADLELIEILPAEQMRALLRQSLQHRGFEDNADRMTRTQGGVSISVDPSTAEVTIHVENSETLEVQEKRESWTSDRSRSGQEQVHENLKEAVRKEIDRKVEKKEDELQRRVSSELEAKLGNVSRELDQVVSEVTREALKIKAASLGAIKEMTEDPEAGSLTIKIEV